MSNGHKFEFTIWDKEEPRGVPIETRTVQAIPHFLRTRHRGTLLHQYKREGGLWKTYAALRSDGYLEVYSDNVSVACPQVIR